MSFLFKKFFKQKTLLRGSQRLLRRESEVFTEGDQLLYLHAKLLLKGVSAFMKYLIETPESIRVGPNTSFKKENEQFFFLTETNKTFNYLVEDLDIFLNKAVSGIKGA